MTNLCFLNSFLQCKIVNILCGLKSSYVARNDLFSDWLAPLLAASENSYLVNRSYKGNVLGPSKGVCADPVDRVAILEVKGPGPPGGVSERQLSPDRGGEKT